MFLMKNVEETMVWVVMRVMIHFFPHVKMAMRLMASSLN
jgi:hypothetical protein